MAFRIDSVTYIKLIDWRYWGFAQPAEDLFLRCYITIEYHGESRSSRARDLFCIASHETTSKPLIVSESMPNPHSIVLRKGETPYAPSKHRFVVRSTHDLSLPRAPPNELQRRRFQYLDRSTSSDPTPQRLVTLGSVPIGISVTESVARQSPSA